MGVEYEHWFLLQDLAIPGDVALARRILGWLDEVGLASSHEIHDIGEGRYTKLGGLHEAGANFMLSTPRGDGMAAEGPSVARLMGPSYHEAAEEERYVQRWRLIVGTELRILRGNEEVFVSTVPAGVDVGRRWQVPDQGWFTADAPIPTSTIEMTPFLPRPDGFTGLFRCALLVDCGKDVPAIADVNQRRAIPDAGVRLRLERAFGGRVTEIGLIY